MDSLTIKKLLKTFSCFKGVFPSDMLPYKASLPINIIVNTDPSHMPGEHWVSISINKNGIGEYFDSFGLPPFKRDIIDFLEKKCEKWSYNQYSLQNIKSNTCGHYCVLNVIYRCQGLSNKRFLLNFNNNTLNNDKRMKNIFGNFSLAKSF
jgi:hypothetical protein